jgi:hypothetical protein
MKTIRLLVSIAVSSIITILLLILSFYLFDILILAELPEVPPGEDDLGGGLYVAAYLLFVALPFGVICWIFFAVLSYFLIKKYWRN